MTQSDSQHLQAARGWLEIGNDIEASAELDKISPRMRMHPDVLEIRWHQYAHVGNWDACLDTAAALVKLAPERVSGWIHQSFSLHKLKRTQEVLKVLLPVVEKFPHIWTIPYNLACCCSQLGRFEEAERWFERAVLIDGEAVEQASDYDPDLKPLWDSMSPAIRERMAVMAASLVRPEESSD